ncbi:hypothetical protein [Vagococcus fessus]|uniref:Uncharacterized protein n=1 Tax=Vagococcus fessus TaxID=120370 RepID=A0A430ACG4_9ENTE|nr:hypothetical protein [Vagococcus fessus]RSU04898.1 hypothetical protein CBF31_02435 [Vagococcus fessus]
MTKEMKKRLIIGSIFVILLALSYFVLENKTATNMVFLMAIVWVMALITQRSQQKVNHMLALAEYKGVSFEEIAQLSNLSVKELELCSSSERRVYPSLKEVDKVIALLEARSN